MSRAIKLTGLTIGRLGVLKEEGDKALCVCVCGNEFVTWRTSLLEGLTQSCGCLCRERTSQANRKHLLTGTRFYVIWKAMKGRCLNPNRSNYKYYGAKGIRVCKEWLTIEGFMADMYESYRPGLTLGRIDHTKDYSKDNCLWITWAQQRKAILGGPPLR